jgi:putative endonuclease
MHFSEKWHFVYIMTNRSKTLYTGITGKLRQRVFEHKTGAFKGLTSKYKLDRLVYFEQYKYVRKRHCSRKPDQGLAKNEKDTIDREHESDVERFGGRLVSGAKYIGPSTRPRRCSDFAQDDKILRALMLR